MPARRWRDFKRSYHALHFLAFLAAEWTLKDVIQVAVTENFSDGARQCNGSIGPLDVDH